MAGRWTSLLALAAALSPVSPVTAQASKTNATAPDPRGQPANPSLLAYDRGIETGQTDEKSLGFSSMRFDIKVRGRTADVVMEAQIANHTDRQMEGRFSLALPQDAVVTGYALDIEGRMIDGVLMDQPKARAVYKEQVRGQIDPGLAEVTGGNRFSTSIYPVMPRGSRTIRVRFSAPFDSATGLIIPLHTAAPVGRFGVMAADTGGGQAAISFAGKALASAGGLDGAQSWERALDGALVIRPAAAPAGLLVSRHSNGRNYFQLAGSGNSGPAVRAGERLRIYWDRSLSRRDDLLAEEIALLERLLAARRPAAIELVTFNAGETAVERFDRTAALAARLKGLSYGGGTSLRGLDAAARSGADSCLLFSDGETTLDLAAPFAPACRVTVISSAADANRTRLGRIARAGGGNLVTLTRDNGAALAGALAANSGAAPAFRDSGGRPIAVRSFADGRGGWLAVGPLPADGIVNAGDKRLTASGSAASDAAGALWAAEQVVALSDNPLDRAAMREMALAHRVASPTMAFLVLESPRQYVDANIVPPQGYSAEWMKEYASVREEQDAAKIAEKEERLAFVLREWAKRKLWWGRSYDGKYVKPKPEQWHRGEAGAPPPPPPPPSPVSEPLPPPPPMAPTPAPMAEAADMSSEIVLTAQRRTDQAAPAAGAAIESKIANVLSDQPYLKALDAAAPNQRTAVLAKQAEEFGDTPAFYFDTAEWFRLKGDKATAMRQLLSALELPSADDETRQIVAFRLQRDGDIDSAIAILERIAVTSDYRPQPKRQLALALAERGKRAGSGGRADLERAFRLLAEVALEPANQAFDGIEVIALMEANALIPLIEAAGGQWVLDKRLTGLLDTDVRILAEWTSDAADLDLHVIEPSGEEVYYGHQLSAAGGLLSNDMTAGYGPEEYVIRRARDGSYKVTVHGFAPDRLNPNGKGRLMVRLIRNFGRQGQQEQLIDADLSFDRASGDNNRAVATITVGNKK